MRTAKKRRLQAARLRARRGGRHRIDISEREQIEASRLHTPLSGAAAVLNAQLQTPEAWEWVWSEDEP